MQPTLALAAVVLASVLLLSHAGTADAKGKSQPQLSVYTKVAKDPITRGSEQTIFVKVMDQSATVSSATIKAVVTYASTKTTKTFTGTTDVSGVWSYTWRIGGNSNPGDFKVDITAIKSGYDFGKASITFKVLPKN